MADMATGTNTQTQKTEHPEDAIARALKSLQKTQQVDTSTQKAPDMQQANVGDVTKLPEAKASQTETSSQQHTQQAAATSKEYTVDEMTDRAKNMLSGLTETKGDRAMYTGMTNLLNSYLKSLDAINNDQTLNDTERQQKRTELLANISTLQKLFDANAKLTKEDIKSAKEVYKLGQQAERDALTNQRRSDKNVYLGQKEDEKVEQERVRTSGKQDKEKVEVYNRREKSASKTSRDARREVGGWTKVFEDMFGKD